MAEVTKTVFDTTYNQSGSGSFLDNTSQAIQASTVRQFAKDIEDSTFFLKDNAFNGAAGIYLNISDTTGLKTVVTASVVVGPLIFYRDSSGNLNSYQLVAGTDAESLPNVVRPNDYDGTLNQKVWKIARPTPSVSATIQIATVTVTSAQLLALYTTPINLIPTPGAGNIIQILSAVWHYVYATAAYATNTDIRIEYGTLAGNPNYIDLNGVISQTTDMWGTGSMPDASVAADLRNLPMQLKVVSGNPTAGGGYINFVIAYTIQSIS